ncbi:hypothetical protein D3C85_1423570 [compost metagenome]
MLRPAFLGHEIGKARVGAQRGYKAMHAFGRAGEKEIDAFFGQQDGALELGRQRARSQRVAQRRSVGKCHKFVAGNIENVGHG